MTPKPLNLEDLQHICRNLRPHSHKEAFACCEEVDPDELAKGLLSLKGDFAWIFSTDRPVYAGGVVECRPGVWESWGLSTDDWHQIAVPMTKFIRRSILPGLRERGAHRLESLCLSGVPEVAKWMSVLGAIKEATLPKRGKNGEDFDLYAWVL